MDNSDIGSKAAEIRASVTDRVEFLKRLEKADPLVAAAVLNGLSSTGDSGAKFDALRDAAVMIYQARLVSDLTKTMHDLDRTAGRLSWVGIALGAIIGIAGIIVPLIAK